MSRMGDRRAVLPMVLAVSVIAELVLLRTTTRVLIHIPGLGRLETPIGIVAEVGRFAFYLALVTLVVSLGVAAHRALTAEGWRPKTLGAVIVIFFVLALLGRSGVMSPGAVGWATLAILVVAGAAVWRGLDSLPIGFFLMASLAAGCSVLAQGDGGGISGGQADRLLLAAEVLLMLAATTSPLLLRHRPTRTATIAGVVVGLLTLGALRAAGPTLFVVVLWNLGIPGWLPAIVYAVAVGASTTTLWTAITQGEHQTAIGLILLIAGGVGVISTYQTGLVLLALTMLGTEPNRVDPAEQASTPLREPVAVL